MTNIVGGNTGNLSQPGSSQDGSSSSPLTKNAGLDFLSLISVVYDGQKSSNGEVSSLDNTGNSENITGPNFSIGLPKGERINSQIEGQLSSDDISAFLKGLNVSSDDDENNVGISTLQLLGRLSKPEEGSSVEVNETSVSAAKDFVKELLSYLEINSIKSGRALAKETSDINAHEQTSDIFQVKNDDILNFISFAPDETYTSDIQISEKSASITSLKKLPFTNLTNATFLYEKNDHFENINKTSFLFNTDISNGDSLSEKKVIEVKVTQNPDLFAVKVFDISNSKIKLAGDVFYHSGAELGINQLDGDKNTLSISIPNKDMAAIVLNVDVDNQGDFDFIPLPVALKPSDAFEIFYQQSSVSTNVDETSIKEISQVLSTSRNKIIGVQPNLKLDNSDEALIYSGKTISTSEKINFPLKENSLKNHSKIFDDVTNMAPLSSKSLFLTDEQMQFVAERLQKANSVTKQDLISGNQITEFIVRSRGNFAIESAISKVMKNEFKTAENTSAKKNLFISTADIIGYRQGAVNSLSDKKLIIKEYSYFDNAISIANTLGKKSEPDLSKNLDFSAVSNSQENRINPVLSAASGNRVDQVSPQSQVSANIATPPKLSLLDAQFTSRMATTLLEQAVNSKENFDLILEPESFGKVRVNVSLENLQLDVKLTAENSATLAILRASEAVLQSITEINGLKLAEYNVELSNNNQNNNGSREQKENSSEKDAKMNENQNELDDKLDSSNDDGSHNLNLIA
jgi:hypothetical protein